MGCSSRFNGRLLHPELVHSTPRGNKVGGGLPYALGLPPVIRLCSNRPASILILRHHSSCPWNGPSPSGLSGVNWGADPPRIGAPYLWTSTDFSLYEKVHLCHLRVSPTVINSRPTNLRGKSCDARVPAHGRNRSCALRMSPVFRLVAIGSAAVLATCAVGAERTPVRPLEMIPGCAANRA